MAAAATTAPASTTTTATRTAAPPAVAPLAAPANLFTAATAALPGCGNNGLPESSGGIGPQRVYALFNSNSYHPYQR